ncbi:MAG: erythromycin esterase family protein [Flammeovirgaceae bacterium]|nr:erythromycin esterase family protein [Flammeovirgaceae bacterium]
MNFFIISLLLYSKVLRAQFITNDIILANKGNDDSFLFRIADKVKDHSIVMLGEPTHGEGNIFKIKTELAKALVKKHGFSIIAFESGLYDLWKANQNMKNGEDYLQSIKDGLFNVWSCSDQMTPLFLLLDSLKQNVKVVGFDVQFSGEYASESMLDDIESIVRKTKIDINTDDLAYWASICEVMAEQFNVPTDFDYIKFNRISDFLISSLDKSKKEEDTFFWIQILKSVKALAHDYHYFNPSSINQNEWKAKNSNNRDRQMANNLLFLKALYPDRKIICWGASAHFAKGFDYVDNDELKEYTPMGKIIADSLGKSALSSIAFSGAKGTYGFFPKTSSVPISLKSIEDSLSNLNFEFAFIPLTQANNFFNAKPLEFISIYNKWSTTFDAFFYTKEITPNHVNCSYKVPNIYIKEDSIETIALQNKKSNSNNSVDKNEYIRSINTDKKFAGKLLDKKSGNPVSYAHITYLHTNLGTVADDNGNFTLYESLNNDTVVITCIGYKKLILTKKSMSTAKPFQLFLEADVTTLNSVVVKGERLDAKSILKNVIKNFNNNYLQTKYTSTIKVSRIIKSRNSSTTKVMVNVLSKVDNNGYTFFSPYPGLNEIETSLIESSTFLIDSISQDTVSYEKSDKRIVAGIAFLDLLNYRKNTFLNPNKWRTYQFELVEILKNDLDADDEVYRIAFKCVKPKHFNTLQLAPKEYWGEIFVNAKDFAIIKFLTFTNQDKDGIWKSKHLPAYKNEANWFNQTVVMYKKINGMYSMDRSLYHSNWDVQNGFIEIELVKQSIDLLFIFQEISVFGFLLSFSFDKNFFPSRTQPHTRLSFLFIPEQNIFPVFYFQRDFALVAFLRLASKKLS